MSDVVPSAAVLAAGTAPAFVLADVDMAEMLAALAPYTIPHVFRHSYLVSLPTRKSLSAQAQV
jgi:hypothetical protein